MQGGAPAGPGASYNSPPPALAPQTRAFPGGRRGSEGPCLYSWSNGPAGGGEGDTREVRARTTYALGALLTLQEFKILTFPGQKMPRF